MTTEATFEGLQTRYQAGSMDVREEAAYGSAGDNADETARELGFERGSSEWMDYFVSSFYASLDD